MKPTLVVLAAGMGSRYGSLKQLDAVGPKGETIIDYSVFDAQRAGFGKVIFIIRESFFAGFKEKITDQFKDKIEVAFAFQAVNSPINGLDNIPEREKPWGTAHAVLVAKDLISEPFAVVNADDFYGAEAFQLMAEFLKNEVRPNHFAMVGYALKNTLSDNGAVSRGICEMDALGKLTTIVERTKIERVDGNIFFKEADQQIQLAEDSLVSMNFWGFHPSIFVDLREQFLNFVKNYEVGSKTEFFIPLVVNNLIERKMAEVRVIPTKSQWFGVTYKDDKELVKKALQELTDKNIYPQGLWVH